MAKAKSFGSGWHGHTIAHSNARKTGSAGNGYRYAGWRHMTSSQRINAKNDYAYEHATRIRDRDDKRRESLEYLRDDSWGRALWQDKKTKVVYAEVDGLLHTLTKEEAEKYAQTHEETPEGVIESTIKRPSYIPKKHWEYFKSLGWENEAIIEAWKDAKTRDSDGDGVPDKYDCDPHDPKKQDDGKPNPEKVSFWTKIKDYEAKREEKQAEKKEKERELETKRNEERAKEISKIRDERIRLEGQARVQRLHREEEMRLKKAKEDLEREKREEKEEKNREKREKRDKAIAGVKKFGKALGAEAKSLYKSYKHSQRKTTHHKHKRKKTKEMKRYE